MSGKTGRVARLLWITTRAVAHILTAKHRPRAWCQDCECFMEMQPDGTVDIDHAPSGRPCPVHVAWRELSRVTLPKAVPR